MKLEMTMKTTKKKMQIEDKNGKEGERERETIIDNLS